MNAQIEIANGQEVRSKSGMPFHAAWITDSEEFRQLRDEWMDLFSRAGCHSAFLSFEWMFLWWKHWGAGGKLAIITIRDSSCRLVALAPLHTKRPSIWSFGLRRLAFLADEHVGSDYLNILVQSGCEEAAIKEIVATLRHHRRDYDYIELRDAEQSPVFSRLCSELQEAGMRLNSEPACVCYYIDLPTGFDEFLAGVGANLRTNFRRRWRKLQFEQKAEFVALASPSDIQRHFGQLITLHRMRFHQRGEESAFLRPGVPEFHTEAAQALASLGWSRIFLVRVDSQPIAALYGFSIYGAFQFFQCGMHTDWLQKFGVGQVLLGNVIREVIATGHRSFDFLRGGEAYKTKWARESRHTITIHCFDSRPGSLVANGLLLAKTWLRTGKGLLRDCATVWLRLVHLQNSAATSAAVRDES
jgi:CelD/BcsL family acetyltransferase involved in cellulose biosynthesis